MRKRVVGLGLTIFVAILSFIIGFATLFITKPVFADEETTNVSTEADLTTALGKSGVVVLSDDIQVTNKIVIPAGVVVTLDLNGHDIVGGYDGSSTTKHIYALANNGMLTVKDSGTDGEIISRGVYNYGTLVLDGGIINACDDNGGYAINNEPGATYTMNGGTIIASFEDGDDYGSDSTALDVPENSITTLNGGKIISVTNYTYCISLHGTLVVPTNSTIEVKGACGALNVSNGTATIEGGTFICSGVKNQTGNVCYISGGTVNISGGVFTHEGANVDADSGAAVVIATGSTAELSISAGSFTGLDGSINGNANTSISGGSFDSVLGYDNWDKVINYVSAGSSVSIGGKTVTKDENGEIYTPSGTLDSGVALDKSSGSYINFELSNLKAKNSIEVKMYSGDLLLATAKLIKTEYLTYTALTVNLCITATSSSWETTWEQEKVYNLVPDNAELYVDGVKVSTVNKITMYNTDRPQDYREWWEVDGVTSLVEVSNNGVVTKFGSLQKAFDYAKENAGDYEIKLNGDLNEDVIIHQVEGVNYIIDGNNKTYSGTITIHGKARYQGEETLTIKNVNFVTDEASHYFIDSNSTDSDKRYAHNVTVENCSFKATGNAVNSAAAMRIRQGFNIKVVKCNSDGLHSILQGYGIAGVEVDGLTITSGKNAVSLGTSTNAVIKNSNINVTGYGVRAGESKSSFTAGMTISNSTINAKDPVVVRYLTPSYEVGYSVTLEGTNTFNASNSNGYAITFTSGDDGSYETPTGEVQLTGSGADSLQVYGMVAKVGNTSYASLKEALESAEDGATVVVLKDTTITEKITVDSNVTLDLNGKIVTVQGVVDSRAIVLSDGCSSFVLNGNGGSIVSADVNSLGIIDVNTTANLIVNGGTYNYDTNNGGLFKFRNFVSNITLNNVNVETNAQISGPNYSGNVLEVNGGTFKAVNMYNVRDVFAFYIQDAKATFTNMVMENEYIGGIECYAGTAVLDNCSISVLGINSKPYLSVAVAVSGNTGNLTINGGSYKTAPKAVSDANGQGATHGSWSVIIMSSGGKLTINDGEFENGNYGNTPASNPRGVINVGADEKYGIVNSELIINGGKFKSIGSIVDCETIWGDTPTMSINITGGEFEYTDRVIGSCDPISTPNPVEVSISGGKYYGRFEESYVPGNVEFFAGNDTASVGSDIDTTYAVAKVGNGYYESLNQAFANAKVGDVVELLSNVTITEEIRIRDEQVLTDITVKGNGNTICANLNKDNQSVLYFGDADLRIYAKGVKIYDLNINATARFGIALMGGTSSILENIGIQGDYVYAIHLYGTHGATMRNCNINAPMFSNGGSQEKLYIYDTYIKELKVNKSDIVEPEGKIYIYNGSVVDTYSFWGDSTEVVVAGIEYINNFNALTTGKIIVATVNGHQYTNLQLAINAATENSVITLKDNVNVADEGLVVASDKVITLDLNGYNIVGTPTEAKVYAVITNKGDLTITGNGEIICNHSLVGNTSYAVNTISNSGTLIIDGATIKNTTTATYQIGYAIDNNSTTNNAILVIENGTIIASGSNYYDGIRQFANSITNQNSVTINGGTISSIWLQNPSDGSGTQNTKDVKGSVTINGGKIDNLWLEPSSNFEASITDGYIGNVAYNDDKDAEGGLLVRFISGGTFGSAIPEHFWAAGYVVVPQNDLYVTITMAEYAEIVADEIRKEVEIRLTQKVYSDAAVNSFENIVLEAIDRIGQLDYVSEINRVLSWANEAFDKVLTEYECQELIIEYAINAKQYAELKKVDFNDQRIIDAFADMNNFALKLEMQMVLAEVYGVIDSIAQENALALQNAKDNAIATLLGTNNENVNNVTSSMIASINVCDTIEQVESALVIAQAELTEIITYKAYIKNASEKANQLATTLSDVSSKLATIESTLNTKFQGLSDMINNANSVIDQIKSSTDSIISNAATKAELQTELDKINTAIAKVTSDVIAYVRDNVLTELSKVSDEIAKISEKAEEAAAKALEAANSVKDLPATLTSVNQAVLEAQQAAAKATEEATKIANLVDSLNQNITNGTNSIDAAKLAAEQAALLAEQAAAAAQKAEEAAKIAAEKAQTTEVKAHAVVSETELKEWLEDYLGELQNAIVQPMSLYSATTVTETDTFRDELIEKLAVTYSKENADLILSYYDQAIAQINASTSKEEINYALAIFKSNVSLVDSLVTLAPAPQYNDDSLVTLLTIVIIVEGVIVLITLIALILAIKARKGSGNGGDTPKNSIAVEEASAVESTETAISEQAEEISESEDDEEAGSKLQINGGEFKTFEERLSSAELVVKQGYQTIRENLLSYKKVNERISKKAVSYRNGRKLLCKMTIVGKTLRVYLALNPNSYEVTKFFQKDVSDKKAYQEVPMLMRVRSGRAIKRVCTLITDIEKANELIKKPQPKQ